MIHHFHKALQINASLGILSGQISRLVIGKEIEQQNSSTLRLALGDPRRKLAWVYNTSAGKT